MPVYVLNDNGQPLMPTKRFGKVRRLLKEGKAEVINRCPFTIRLNYHAEENVQPVVLGIDAGSKIIGVSATTEDSVLYEAEIEVRNDISDLLAAKRELRRARRGRKTRYRKPRFLNRTASKKKGWFAPSVKQKVETHLTVIRKVHELLPVSSIIVETAQFDLQRIKAMEEGRPIPEGTDYQNGETKDFANLREYCFHRDGYTCQYCKGKSGDKVLHMHHWNYWRGDHSNKPDSVITLCATCNDSSNHKKGGPLWGWEPRLARSYKDAAFMGIMRWALYNELKRIYPDVKMTYGYMTKDARIRAGLPKAHYTDARCISGHPNAKSLGYCFYQKKVRCHNRQIHKLTISKGGYRKNNQAAKYVFGYQLFDKVSYKGKECFIFGRRSSGSFDIRTLDGTKVSAGVSYRKLKRLEKRKSFLTERRVTMQEVRAQ